MGGAAGTLPDTWWNWERPVTGNEIVNDPFRALGQCPIQRAVNLLAGDIARLPTKIVEYTDDRRWEDCDEYPELDAIFNDQANEYFSSFEWWRWMSSCCLIWGNSFSVI